MFRVLVVVLASVFWQPGPVSSSKVHQSPPDVLLKFNSTLDLKCSHSDTNYNTILWYQQLTASSELKLIGYLYYKSVTIETEFKELFEVSGDGEKEVHLHFLKLRQAQDDGMYFCAARARGTTGSVAYFGNGTKLTVLDPLIPKSEPSVKILNAPQKESCKKKVTLVCWAEDFYPDHVKVAWFVGQQEITEDVATDPHATFVEGKKYTISSRLKVSQKMWKKSTNKFTCIVSYYNGSVTTEQSASVYGVAGGYDRDSYVKSSQWMKLAYGVTIAKSGLYGLVIFVFVWRKGSNEK